MKSRKVKAIAKAKAFISSKKRKGEIALDGSDDSGSDIDPSSYYQDEIDDFHKREDEKLSTDDELIAHDDDSSEEEEVLPITDDEKDEWEDNDSDSDLPNLDAWGKKKSNYYSADFVDEDRGRSYRAEDAEEAKAEEEGALELQRQFASIVTAEHFDYPTFQSSESSDEEQEDKVPDWSSASKDEKMKMLKKTSPELLLFIDEFKDKLAEVKDQIVPLVELTNQGKIPGDKCCDFLNLKYQLIMHYCMNISFYMVLKSQGTFVSNHPVLTRIFTYKTLLDQLKPVDEKLQPEIKFILEKIRNGEDIKLKTESSASKQENILQNGSVNERLLALSMTSSVNEDIKQKDRSKAKDVKSKPTVTESENKILSMYMDMKAKQQKKPEEKSIEDMDVDNQEQAVVDEKETEEKRLITYQISKNKGLTPYRKKEHRNPRVRNRMKFKKATIRRKGQVKSVRKELTRYDGEATGISTHVVRSIKLK